MTVLRLALVVSLGLVAGCASAGSKGTVPASSELQPFEPPDEDELVGEEEAEAEDVADTEATPEVAPAPAPAPAAPPGPAPAPVKPAGKKQGPK